MSTTKWLPLESNPDVMNKYLKNLGVAENLGISDVISLDEEFLDKIPTPSLALLFLIPMTPKYIEFQKEQEKKKEEVEGVYFMKQTIKNACGTVALIHAIANNESFLKLHPDSVLKNFLNDTKDMSPEERGRYLEQDKNIIAVHETCAQEGQTDTPNLDDEINKHFITFVNVNDKLIELDGRKSGPILHGTTNEETFLKDASRICKEYMQLEPDNHNFSALTFGSI